MIGVVMKPLKLFMLALAVMCVLGVATASSAFALPDVSIALGGAYPINNVVTLLTVATKLSNPVENLKGVGLLLQIIVPSLTTLGTFDVLFDAVENAKGSKCNSEGDPTGEVLLPGTWHLVYTSLSPLKLGELFLPEEVKIVCGSVKIKVKGASLAALNLSAEATEITGLSGILTGDGAGHAATKNYYNDAGESEVSQLLSNFGTTFKESAEEVAEEVTATAAGSKMFEVTTSSFGKNPAEINVKLLENPVTVTMTPNQQVNNVTVSYTAPVARAGTGGTCVTRGTAGPAEPCTVIFECTANSGLGKFKVDPGNFQQAVLCLP
jgi:hypothetical protein